MDSLAKFLVPPSRWPLRVRAGILVLMLLLGLGVAAVEKAYQADAYRLWGRLGEGLDVVLNPVRGLTRQGVFHVKRMQRLWRADIENQRLSLLLGEERIRNQLLAEQLGRLQRLSGLERWTAPPELRLMPADVIGRLRLEEGDGLVLNRGRLDGVRPGHPVVARGGLVGTVRATTDRSARVQTLLDPLGVVGAVNRATRVRGTVEGRGTQRRPTFRPESRVEPLREGAAIITSGFDNSLFPKGILIGRIVRGELDPYGLPYAVVQPAVDVESVEEVLIILPARPAFEDGPTTAPLGRYRIETPSAPTTRTTAVDAPTTATPSPGPTPPPLDIEAVPDEAPTPAPAATEDG